MNSSNQLVKRLNRITNIFNFFDILKYHEVMYESRDNTTINT